MSNEPKKTRQEINREVGKRLNEHYALQDKMKFERQNDKSEARFILHRIKVQ